MRSLIRQRGAIAPVSQSQDTHLGEMTISAVFSEQNSGFVPSILGTVPPTGTPIQIVDDSILDKLLERYKDQLFYLGNVYGSKPKLPLWFKHFGTGKNGAGEAYHLGIFGKTGSGKSTLAKMILLGYAKHPNMSIFIIDPQGEFTKDVNDTKTGKNKIPFKEIIEKCGKKVNVYNVQDLVFDRWSIFKEILVESPFFERLTIPTRDKRITAAEVLIENLKRNDIRLNKLTSRNSFNRVIEILRDERVQTQIYPSQNSRRRFSNAVTEINIDIVYNEYWLPITKLFNDNRENAYKIDSILYKSLRVENYKPVTIINLANEDVEDLYWNENIKALIINRLLDSINMNAENSYKEGKYLNTLVVFDEAHRFARREKYDNSEREAIKDKLVDYVRTTRKYGLGWMFISQTLSSLHKDIIGQLRIFFFGFGLSMGAEFNSLKELAGGSTNALKLYQNFRDPQSSFDIESREYSFMTIGPVSPLSFSGVPLFFNAFNKVDKFLQENNLK